MTVTFHKLGAGFKFLLFFTFYHVQIILGKSRASLYCLNARSHIESWDHICSFCVLVHLLTFMHCFSQDFSCLSWSRLVKVNLIGSCSSDSIIIPLDCGDFPRCALLVVQRRIAPLENQMVRNGQTFSNAFVLVSGNVSLLKDIINHHICPCIFVANHRAPATLSMLGGGWVGP